MPNNENDLSDNSGNPHIGSNFDDFLEEEGIREEVEATADRKDFERRMKDGPIMRIYISGPVGIGKTILATRIERLLKEEFAAKDVLVEAQIRQDQNAMNMADWQVSMADRMAKTIYTIDEDTVDQVKPSGVQVQLDSNDTDPVGTVEKGINAFKGVEHGTGS